MINLIHSFVLTIRDHKSPCAAWSFMVSNGMHLNILEFFHTILDLMLSIILAIKSIVSSMLVMNSVVVV